MQICSLKSSNIIWKVYIQNLVGFLCGQSKTMLAIPYEIHDFCVEIFKEKNDGWVWPAAVVLHYFYAEFSDMYIFADFVWHDIRYEWFA